MIITRVLKPVILLTHLALIAVGVSGILGHGSAFVTQHSVLGPVINYGLILSGLLGGFAVCNGDDEVEIVALYLQSVLIGSWGFFILLSLVEHKGGTWGGFFGISDWSLNMLLRALWLAGAIKVVTKRE